MQAGKTIAAKREKPEADSERERVRRVIRRRKVLAIGAVIALGGLLLFLGVKAFQEWIKWMGNREEVIVIGKTPSVEVIDDSTGQVFDNKSERKLSTRTQEYIANLEEEFALKELKITRARIPADKIREVDVEVDGFSGLIKVSTDRNPAVTAEDAVRMINYMREQEIEECEYIDVRIERKAYWK
ncbi:hypothetical protein IKG20_03375 [Candidatus Saccharibacteria bacterium]|nr:hypothetical protein [Candidatus Saccharibacteria bacterium]